MNNDEQAKVEQPPHWRLRAWFPGLADDVHEQLEKYFAELQKFNKVINLISSKTLTQADAIHFADSIQASQIVRTKASKTEALYDIGSGNGFPGMVYGILYPDQKIILVDSDERKCEFLKHTAEALGLLNVTVKNRKIEQLGADDIAQAICRGFSPLPKALLILRKILKTGGVVYHMKSGEWAMEISQIPIQLCSTWQPVLDAEYVLPIGGVKMYIVRTSKIK